MEVKTTSQKSPFTYVSEDFLKMFGECDFAEPKQKDFFDNGLDFKSLHELCVLQSQDKEAPQILKSVNLIHVPKGVTRKSIVLDFSHTAHTRSWCIHLIKNTKKNLKAMAQTSLDEIGVFTLDI